MARGMNLAPAPSPLDAHLFRQALRSMPARMSAKISFDPATSCWNWTGARNERGYGRYWISSKQNMVAHRAVYEMLMFKVKPGMEVGPACRNNSCVNPDHRSPITRSETLRRGLSGEALAAAMRAKTHCPQGHEYTEANTNRRSGKRHCRACERIRAARKRAAAKQQQVAA